MERIAKRTKDASDATADVVSAQAKQPTGAVDWLRVDASSPVVSIVSRVLAAISG
jgi:predicted kinase